jgi:hypothetical protein
VQCACLWKIRDNGGDAGCGLSAADCAPRASAAWLHPLARRRFQHLEPREPLQEPGQVATAITRLMSDDHDDQVMSAKHGQQQLQGFNAACGATDANDWAGS